MLRGKSLIFVSAAFLAVSCAQSLSSREQTLSMLSDALAEGRHMYAHQDDLCYGHSWYLEDGRSDVRDVCGDYPAIVGFDLGGIELGDSLNLDRVPFENMRKLASDHIARGGLVTFSWHPRNPLTGGDAWDVSSDKVVSSILPGGDNHEKFMGWLGRAADLLESIDGGRGIIFRPWHENLGDWFWWCEPFCSADDYQALWELTYDYMTVERGLDLVWTYSPNAGITAEKYMSRYPGDSIVDILGLDAYQYGSAESFQSLLREDLSYVGAIASEHGKLAALTETGYESIPGPKWWTEVLEPAIEGSGICYVLTWRNAPDRPTHFYGPFKGAVCEKDFIEFYNNEKTLFLNDIRE